MRRASWGVMDAAERAALEPAHPRAHPARDVIDDVDAAFRPKEDRVERRAPLGGTHRDSIIADAPGKLQGLCDTEPATVGTLFPADSGRLLDGCGRLVLVAAEEVVRHTDAEESCHERHADKHPAGSGRSKRVRQAAHCLTSAMSKKWYVLG